jgi:hypothetical protein
MCPRDYALRIALCICALAGWTAYVAAANRTPDAVTPDGGRYYGSLKDGKLHGRGRLEWKGGAFYEGEFRDGQMAGRGKMREVDGSAYVGRFRNGDFNGRGRYRTADGDVYEGSFRHGRFHGHGRLTAASVTYEGEFRQGHFWGRGEAHYSDGRKYQGDFVRGRYQGKGRFEYPDGAVYEGDFVKDDFTGSGTYTRKDGARYEGEFSSWRMHGKGRYSDSDGNVYEGRFVNGEFTGPGRWNGKGAGSYEGEFRQWRFHGQGVLKLPNGDEYSGGFAHGMYEGEGRLRYAKPRADGATQASGKWRFGRLDEGEAARERAKADVELALYGQRSLLDKALAGIVATDPAKINLYLLAVAGDGAQEVFRREVEFVRGEFDRVFATLGRSVALVNSRTTVATAPMATVTSIRESLFVIASRMDKDRDILFLFLTSHGSKEHELTLNQNNMTLRGLRAQELGNLLRESGIRWKVVVVSACYSGGFIDAIGDEGALVMTAARRDRQSFGCADDNDFTYFGRAFFKEALPGSSSFQEAFAKAEMLVKEWETKHAKTAYASGGAGQAGRAARDEEFSLPQIHDAKPIREHLQRWWAQQLVGKENR